ncbi:MAG TPA: twin-arginine translocase TatA/TatE family subunit [Chloroflexota bacterium]|nr:twin-arginine translocase TatA/TatE family subunit [Chloroflexota bacterium]
MNFLGMGPMELMVILVLALIVFGPGKLPEIAGQVGRVVRDFRRMTGDLSSEFNRTLSLEIEERKAAQAPAPPLPPQEYDAAGQPVAVEGSASVATAYEPSEAPPVPVTTASNGTALETAPAAPAVAEAPAPASKRRTIDPDLAPPY